MKIIQTYLADLLNGEGLRDCYFFSGCELHCSGCFSPETWDHEKAKDARWECLKYIDVLCDGRPFIEKLKSPSKS